MGSRTGRARCTRASSVLGRRSVWTKLHSWGGQGRRWPCDGWRCAHARRQDQLYDWPDNEDVPLECHDDMWYEKEVQKREARACRVDQDPLSSLMLELTHACRVWSVGHGYHWGHTGKSLGNRWGIIGESLGNHWEVIGGPLVGPPVICRHLVGIRSSSGRALLGFMSPVCLQCESSMPLVVF